MGSDHIVVTSLTFQGHVTSLHGHMTWIPHRPFPIGGPLKRPSISNGFRVIQWRMWRNGWHDLNTTSKQGQSALVVVTCILHRRDSWSFLERGQNMALKLCRPRTSCLEQSTCWAASFRRVPRYLMANVTQWLNDLDRPKQTSKSISHMTSYRLWIGPSNLILL